MGNLNLEDSDSESSELTIIQEENISEEETPPSPKPRLSRQTSFQALVDEVENRIIEAQATRASFQPLKVNNPVRLRSNSTQNVSFLVKQYNKDSVEYSTELPPYKSKESLDYKSEILQDFQELKGQVEQLFANFLQKHSN